MSKKPKTVFERYQAIQALQPEVSVPWEVWRMLGNENGRVVSISGAQVSLGEDYGSLQEVRNAISWYVQQLGGTVTWKG